MMPSIFSSKPKRYRAFDSQAADAASVHRQTYQDDCGAIHAIGTGGIIVYGRGPEWMQVFGPPYSSPTMLSLVAAADDRIVSRSSRAPETNIWRHELAAGEIVDCAPRQHQVIARHWRLNGPVRFLMDFHGFHSVDQSAVYPGCSGAWLISAPANTAFYNDYPSVHGASLMVCARGGFCAQPSAEGLVVTLSGEGTLLLYGARTYPEADQAMRRLYHLPFEQMLADCADEERWFNQARLARQLTLKAHPLAQRALDAAQDAAMLIRAQQSDCGGILAGHNYHLAYVRDQYGVFRGLLAMGCQDEAKAILRFYLDVFTRHGYIRNAQAMGVDGIFHVHENDSVEITGYLIHQSILMLRATGDRGLFDALCPMLDWALRAQLEQLHADMLPFNGDETYVAGGFMPRTALNHGSFEATLLLLSGGDAYLNLRGKTAKPADWVEPARQQLAAVKASFERNFRRGGYVTNSLLRLDGLAEPEFRHGVCVNNDGYFGWTRRIAEGYYVCPACAAGQVMRTGVCREEYQLNSAILMAPYLDSPVISPGVTRVHVAQFLKQYRASGQLPSLPDGDRCLGYDFGLLLYAAAHLGLDADDLLEHMLDVQDGAGAWAEYYRRNQPQQTRCRPWESAINIEGALSYLRAQAPDDNALKP
jgi:hypothetical protein